MITEKQALTEMSKATHLIKFNALNIEGNEKKLFTFVNVNDSWFDNSFEAINKIETINANLGRLLKADETVKEYNSIVYKLNPFREIIKFETTTKSL